MNEILIFNEIWFILNKSYGLVYLKKKYSLKKNLFSFAIKINTKIMKKSILTLSVLALFFQKANACADYDPDGDYFNLFTQSIIKDKSYLPFLLTYANRFYDHQHYEIPDENIQSWQKFFSNKLTYAETKNMVYDMPLAELNAYKNNGKNTGVFKKLGYYYDNAEAIDYLIQAKTLEPFMRINYIANEDSYYSFGSDNPNNATSLDNAKTIATLTNLYQKAQNNEIKLRYGYQLVRFNHYTRNYQGAIDAFNQFVAPLNLKTAPYFWALDQMAGAQRGLQKSAEANWNFFQVFINSPSRRENVFVSMKLTDQESFKKLLDQAKTTKEKEMVQFLLAYDGFSNPLPAMEKIYEINPNSELLKVLTARAINELERQHLPYYYSNNSDIDKIDRENFEAAKSKVETTGEKGQKVESKKETQHEQSFWDKIVSFFKNLFSSKKDDADISSQQSTEEKKKQSDDDLLNNPNRLPVLVTNNDEESKDYSEDLQKFIQNNKDKDEFYQIADAYIHFLKKNYDESKELLTQIKTDNPEYQEQITRLKLVNDIASRPRVDAEFENYILKNYSELFAAKKVENPDEGYYNHYPSTLDFVMDILANRYFLQGENGKAFLVHHKLSDLQYNPNSFLVKEVQDFVNKKNKTEFEKNIIGKNIDDVGDANSFFNLIYGDNEMRLANFNKAREHYKKVTSYKGDQRFQEWDSEKQAYKPYDPNSTNYDGFKNISSLIFGHNVWESYTSEPEQSMKAEDLSKFNFIKDKMNKLELAEAVLQLQKIGNGKDVLASKANQLIGNLLYNTSILGYYRNVFVMDVDNSNGGKYNFWQTDKEMPYRYYYKDVYSFIKPENFDYSIKYYQKALDLSQDEEQKARILFQMASAEQGKYYQWEAQQPKVSYSEDNYEQLMAEQEKKFASTKNGEYRTYFNQLKSKYGNTQTAQALRGSCSYFDYFMKGK